jgi:NodT family efflux transporter outer membrane factor (OMF) lipoprotein
MKRSLFFMSLFSLFEGCKVGPDYHIPEVDVPINYSEDQDNQTFSPSDEDLVAWWTILNDPFLNGLLEETVAYNFDYRIALEQVYQARAQYWIQFTQILPEIDFDAQAVRFRQSQAFASTAATAAAANSSATTTATTASTNPAAATAISIPPIQNFFQLGFDAIWEIDFFGKLRRTAEAAYDNWQATDEMARNVKIIVLSEVANTYTLICAYQKKVNLTAQIVTIDEELLELSIERFQAGLANEQQIENALATLETDKGALNVLQIILKQNIYSLATLLGRLPETIIEEFKTERSIPIARGKVPAGLPAELLRRRHDIRSSERQLAAATEEIGVAVAQLYPSVSLVGSSSSFAANPLQGANIGYSTDTASKLFSGSARVWGIGALFVLPMIDFGKRLAGVEMEVALQHQAYFSFQKTVIAALEEVEQALTAYLNEEKREKSLSLTAHANKRNFDLTLDLFQAGLADYSQVLQAKEIWLNAVTALTDSQQALTSDLIAVYKSLGGDW